MKMRYNCHEQRKYLDWKKKLNEVDFATNHAKHNNEEMITNYRKIVNRDCYGCQKVKEERKHVAR